MFGARWFVAVALSFHAVCWANDTVLTTVISSPLGLIVSLGKWILSDRDTTFLITVEGRGSTVDQARRNGWQLAIQQAVGTVHLREVEKNKTEITVDRQLMYSSGFVREWRDLRVSQLAPAQWAVLMEVWVSDSKLADGLVGRTPTPGNFPGTTLAQQMASRIQELEQGQALIEAVLGKWPGTGAAILELSELRTELDADRKPLMFFDIQVGMTAAYEKSLYAALDAVAANPRQNYWDLWYNEDFFWRKSWRIRDRSQFESLRTAFDRPVILRVTFRDSDHIVAQRCWDMKLEGRGNVLPNRPVNWRNVRIDNLDLSDLHRINRVDFELQGYLCR